MLCLSGLGVDSWVEDPFIFGVFVEEGVLLTALGIGTEGFRVTTISLAAERLFQVIGVYL